MPFPNEISARLEDPGKFDKFRRENDAGGSGVDFIYGIKAGKSELQAIRFKADKFTTAQARAWLKSHDKSAISVTAATGEHEEFVSSSDVVVPVAGIKKEYMETVSMEDIFKTLNDKDIS